MAARRQPFTIVTKSSLVERDIDLLAPFAANRLVGVYVTVTTLDADLARRWEPRAAAPWRRLAEMRSDHGRVRLSDPRLFSRMTDQGPWAELIRLRFELATRRLGLARRLPGLRIDLFRRGGDTRQLGLF